MIFLHWKVTKCHLIDTGVVKVCQCDSFQCLQELSSSEPDDLYPYTLQCHNERNGVSNYQPHDCLLNRLCRRRSKKTSKLCVTGLCAGNSPVTGEFPTQMASNAENVSIWWHHHEAIPYKLSNDTTIMHSSAPSTCQMRCYIWMTLIMSIWNTAVTNRGRFKIKTDFSGMVIPIIKIKQLWYILILW